MRLGGRLAAAIEVLDDIERRHRPAAEALKDWGVSHRFAGAGDRSAIGNIVYDALRRRRSAGWLFESESTRATAFGALLLEWGLTPDALDRALDGDRFGPEPLSQAEHEVLSGRRLADAPDAVRADCPDWCAPLLEESFGADWVEEAAALSARPPLDLRVNTLLSSRDAVAEELEDAGATPTALAPNGLRIAPIAGDGRHPNVQAEPAFHRGWFEVQDEGSQIAAVLADAQPGMRVLDYCAGAGGKTLALAATMRNEGEIVAHDADKTRLAPIFERVRRAGATCVNPVSKLKSPGAAPGSFDLVLIDAPCTGSGTWRRRPDAKWRLSRRQLDVRRGEQASILAEASRFVKPGGRLAYVTCSVFAEENGAQAAAFLADNPGFAALDHRALFERHVPGRASAVRIDGVGGLILSPLRAGTDGFYFAGLLRSR